jgi:hypothetical protein
MNAFIRLTQNAACSPLWHQGDAYSVTYQLPNGQQRMLAWSVRPQTVVRVTGQLDAVHDFMGNSLTDVPSAGQNLTLKPIPVYLTGKDLKLEIEPR